MAKKQEKQRSEEDLISEFSQKMAARVVQARDALGMNPAEMARALEIPYPTYVTYENGRTPMRPWHLVKFCLLTGYSPWHFYTGRPNFEADYKKQQSS